MSGNVAAAKERLAFADRNISSARDLAGHAVSGQQSGLVDAVRAAESALGQARALLDAVDNAAGDIQHAVATLPSVMTDIQAGIQRANEQLQRAEHQIRAHRRSDRGRATRRPEPSTAARSGSADPLGAFARLTKADADLNRLLASWPKNRRTPSGSTARSSRRCSPRSRGCAGSPSTSTPAAAASGPKLAPGSPKRKRHLEAAQDKKSTNLTEAIAHANAASTLAANAQSLANADVQSAQRAYTAPRGATTSAP